MLIGLLVLLFVFGRSIVGWFLETHTNRSRVSVADEAQAWLTTRTPPTQ